MSYINRLPIVEPPTPAEGYVDYVDAVDLRYKLKFSNGQVVELTAVAPNQVINGGFDHAQRQVPGTLTTRTTTTGRIYTADRWFATVANADLQYQRVDSASALEPGLDARFYGRFKKITTAGKFVAGYIIPGDQTSALQGRKVMAQAKMKRGVAAAMSIRMGLAQLTAAGTIDVIPGYVAGAPSGTFISAFGAAGTDPTFGTNVALITPNAGSEQGGIIVGNALTVPLTSNWVASLVGFTVPTDAKNLILLFWANDNLAALDEFNISEVDLHEGTAQQDWRPLSSHLELFQCQRFYSKSFPYAVAPAQNAGVTGAVSAIAGKAGAVALAGNLWINFPVVMRSVPTVTAFSPTAASAHVTRITGTSPIAHTATAQIHLSDDGLMFTSTGTTNTAVGDVIAVHYTADAEL
jgi:hypothetical protein